MILWPTHILPSPNIDYTEAPLSSVSRTEFERTIRQRQKYSTQDYDKNVFWIFDRFQYDFFIAFFHHSLKLGKERFFIDLPGLDGLVSTEVSMLDGEYSVDHLGGRYWRVSTTLRAEDVDKGSETATQLLISLTGGSPDAINCSLIKLYSYIEFHYGDSNSLPNCN